MRIKARVGVRGESEGGLRVRGEGVGPGGEDEGFAPFTSSGGTNESMTRFWSCTCRVSSRTEWSRSSFSCANSSFRSSTSTRAARNFDQSCLSFLVFALGVRVGVVWW